MRAVNERGGPGGCVNIGVVIGVVRTQPGKGRWGPNDRQYANGQESASNPPVNEDGTINGRWATKAEVGNSDDRTIEKTVVEEPPANAADPPDAVVIEDGPVQDGIIIHHWEERRPSESKPNRYSLTEETPAAGKVFARERSVKTGVLKERPVVNGAAEKWMAMGKARRNRRQSTTDGRSERRSVEKGLPEERRSGGDPKLTQEETSSRRSTAEIPAEEQPQAEDQSTDAGAVEDLPVRRGSSETGGRPAEDIATNEKPVRYGLVQGHLENQSSLRVMKRNGTKHGDTVRGYINIGSLHHQEAVPVDRTIRKNLISRAFANELQLEI
ncbi:hypothetical protein OQA88_11956 [Cercophora sp. LCS_1]